MIAISKTASKQSNRQNRTSQDSKADLLSSQNNSSSDFTADTGSTRSENLVHIYLQEVKRTPLLKVDEEKTLARRIARLKLAFRCVALSDRQVVRVLLDQLSEIVAGQKKIDSMKIAFF